MRRKHPPTDRSLLTMLPVTVPVRLKILAALLAAAVTLVGVVALGRSICEAREREYARPRVEVWSKFCGNIQSTEVVGRGGPDDDVEAMVAGTLKTIVANPQPRQPEEPIDLRLHYVLSVTSPRISRPLLETLRDLPEGMYQSTTLVLHSREVTDDALDYIAHLDNLTRVEMSGCTLAPERVGELKRRCPFDLLVR